MMINKSAFYYSLPKELIAQEPLPERSASRLMLLNRQTGEVKHRHFKDIVDILDKNDVLVINDTKVMPCRLFGTKETGAVIEVLLVKRTEGNKWEALLKPGKRVKIGDTIVFGDVLRARLIDKLSDGITIIELFYDGIFEEILDSLGEMPLPHYITGKLADSARYQTVYADKSGSAAAPTAGLHFTDDIFDALAEKGVGIAKVTLHVGLGTFRPIKSENILEHKMHTEMYEVNEETSEMINNARQAKKRIICVGTTSVRTMESACDGKGLIKAGRNTTDIFIYPGYVFKVADGLITNFHLPESTLIALVSAFAGTDNVLNAYECAVRERYRFFSFGDAMLIV
jgi:S-adenosylmethionine:tRNA ribosyltransferase-isomerase